VPKEENKELIILNYCKRHRMKIIYIDLDGVLADFEKGKREHPLGNITLTLEDLINYLVFMKI
jgi:hypothetical protein